MYMYKGITFGVNKQEDDMEEETLLNEPERPLKRLRRGGREVNQV